MNKNITIEPISGGYIVKDFETDITFLSLDILLKTIEYYYGSRYVSGLSLEDAYNKAISEFDNREWEYEDYD